MPTKRVSLRPGTRYGHLTVLESASPVQDGDHLRSASLCKCDCGNVRVVINTEMIREKIKCCGMCKWANNYKHGDCYTKLYRKWKSMIDRCKHHRGPRDKRYIGIQVCDDWLTYKHFKDWALANGYKDGLSIDRIDPSGNYEPSNCRFIPMSEQANNKRNTIYLTVDGQRKSLMEWSRILCLDAKLIRSRLAKGLDDKRALAPVKTNKSKRR